MKKIKVERIAFQSPRSGKFVSDLNMANVHDVLETV